MADTRGAIWLTALPVNRPGSAQVRFDALQVTGDTQAMSGNLLVALGRYPPLTQAIADSLTQNFGSDIDQLLGKIRRAMTDKRKDAFVINATLGRVETGRVQSFGQGLFLPVRAVGEARVSYSPRLATGG
jgi:hypothetical protein